MPVIRILTTNATQVQESDAIADQSVDVCYTGTPAVPTSTHSVSRHELRSDAIHPRGAVENHTRPVLLELT